jgi:hypothetical protein
VLFVISPLELQRKPWRAALHVSESRPDDGKQNDIDDPECQKGSLSAVPETVAPKSKSETACL